MQIYTHNLDLNTSLPACNFIFRAGINLPFSPRSRLNYSFNYCKSIGLQIFQYYLRNILAKTGHSSPKLITDSNQAINSTRFPLQYLIVCPIIYLYQTGLPRTPYLCIYLRIHPPVTSFYLNGLGSAFCFISQARSLVAEQCTRRPASTEEEPCLSYSDKKLGVQ